MAYDAQSLMKMSGEELDELFTDSPAGDIRTAKAKAPRSSRRVRPTPRKSPSFINHFAWQGKIFDAKAGF